MISLHDKRCQIHDNMVEKQAWNSFLHSLRFLSFSLHFFTVSSGPSLSVASLIFLRMLLKRDDLISPVCSLYIFTQMLLGI